MDYERDLATLVGKKIKSVKVSVTTEFGDPVLELRKIVFEDDTFLQCEGEHDLPYLTTDVMGDNYPSEDVLNEILKEYEEY